MRLDILGVAVDLEAPPGDATERLLVIYAALADRGDPCRPAIRARLGVDGDGFRVRVDGRPEATATSLVEALRALNHQLLHAIMQERRDLLFVHAGVVVCGDAGAVVLPGLSMAGKSTLVLSLVLACAELVSDELLAYDPERREILPVPRAIKVRDVCVPYFPGLASGFLGTGEGRFLRLGAMPGGARTAPATPIGFVFPRYDAAGSNSLRPMTSGEALLGLAASALNFGAHRQASVDHLASLLGRARAASLAWNDPQAATAAILAHFGVTAS